MHKVAHKEVTTRMAMVDRVDPQTHHTITESYMDGDIIHEKILTTRYYTVTGHTLEADSEIFRCPATGDIYDLKETARCTECNQVFGVQAFAELKPHEHVAVCKKCAKPAGFLEWLFG